MVTAAILESKMADTYNLKFVYMNMKILLHYLCAKIYIFEIHIYTVRAAILDSNMADTYNINSSY
jgi:hypothetical protein